MNTVTDALIVKIRAPSLFIIQTFSPLLTGKHNFEHTRHGMAAQLSVPFVSVKIFISDMPLLDRHVSSAHNFFVDF
ncbi:hypothetical protein Plhal304r1_c002g0009181 [Plasmopara halstedii]